MAKKNAENNGDIDKWHAIMEMQNNNFLELMKVVKNDKSTTQEKKLIVLPKFDPDTTGSDASSWSATVDIIFGDNPPENSDLIILLSTSLAGSASQWLSTICFVGIKWCEFKELFLQRFGGVETPAATIFNILNSHPKQSESLAVFGSRIVTTLLSCWKNIEKEQIAVSLALAHVAKIDQRLKRTLFTNQISTRNDLQKELQMFTHIKVGENKQSDNFMGPDAKRMKIAANIRCHFCGMFGHKIADCKSRDRTEKGYAHSAAASSLSTVTKEKPSVTCYKCRTVGHFASQCPKTSSSFKSVQSEKRVNLCEIEPMGELIQSGESYSYYFDSGAECSLIKENIAAKFSGKRISNCVILRGIGNAKVSSTLQILSNIIINDYSLEVLFHVVANEILKFNLIIGREILYLGFGVNITSRKFVLFKNPELSVDVCLASKDQLDFDRIDTDLFNEDKENLISLLKKFAEWFIDGIPKTRVTTGQLEIRLRDPNKTVQRRPYRLSPDERIVVKNRIQELIEAKIIQPSSSPFASPILLVKKKNGSDRLCVDYRELNSNTIADRFPLPLISDQVARLRGAQYFTCLDMASGFHQIPVHPQSVELTAFVTPDGQFEYLTMPFGLKNAPSVFQRAISKALGDLIYSFVIVYMDDIMIVASSKEEALQRLDIVLNVLTKAGFSLNISKCAFMKTCIEYLGFVVTAGEVRPNPRKIKALTDLPPPQSVSQLRQFIGLASYFRQFVHKFSQIMKPLYFLVNAKNFIWKSQHEVIRNKIISVLTNKPVLVIFDPQYPIELHTDACQDGYGAILLHKINDKPHVIEYYSKRTTQTESRYHSYELETLALVNAVKHFRHYLQGRKFVVFTDCNSLKATRNKIELTPRVHRWWAYLQSFDFDVQYRDGKRMAHADFFSRNHTPKENNTDAKVLEKRINIAEISHDWLLAEQQKDAEISAIKQKLLENELPIGVANTYELRKGTLYRKIQRAGKTHCVPIVPRSFRWSVINSVHESIMHLGWEKTLDKVYDYFWFDNMCKYVKRFVENCITCKLSKSSSGKIAAELHSIPKVSIPWHTLHMDITGKLSGKSDLKEYVIVLIDAFTKYVLLYHSTNINSENCVRALRNSISLFGVPTRVIADQGRSFTGKQFNEFCSSQKIDLHLIATGASRANGQVERVMSTLKNLLTAVEISKRSWQDALSDIQLAINCTNNRVTMSSPLEMLIGKKARPLGLLSIDNDEQEIDVANVRMVAEQNMKCNASYDKARFDKNKSKVVRFCVGDYVLIKAEERHQTKLDAKFKGPFLITEVLDGDRYILKSLTTNRTYKYAHECLRKLPDQDIPKELDSNIVDNENMLCEENVEKDVEGVEKDTNENIERNKDVERGIGYTESEEIVEMDCNNSECIDN